MTFDDVMQFTGHISSPTAFEDPECRAYFDLLVSLPRRSTIMEIGLQFGRSSSIALQVAKVKDHRYIGVDPFTDPPDARNAWGMMADDLGATYTLMKMTSRQASQIGHIFPDLILVDGDHTREGVLSDLQCWTDIIFSNGYMCFHDYGRESLPDVYPTVQTYMADYPAWKEVTTVGTLGIWRKELC